MKKFLFFVFMLSLTLPASAQLGRQYTYVSDRNFFDVEQLIGYDFCPGEIETKSGEKRLIRPGEYSFGVTREYLYVEGPNIKGVYNVSSLNTTEYGFIITIINTRDARLQGHLKVVLNKYSQADALIFRRSPQEEELILLLPLIADDLRKREAAYFTDWGEMPLAHPDSLWGKKIYPFFRIHTDKEVQERLQIADSTSISFREEITLEEKVVKKPVYDSVGVMIDSGEVRVKEIREYFVVVRSILQFDDGSKEDTTVEFPVKKITERASSGSNLSEEKFEWEVENEKGAYLRIYLNAQRQIASVRIGGEKYLVRGY